MSDVYLWDTYEKVGREALERRDYSQAIESFRSAVTVAEKLPGEELRLVMSLRHLSGATAKAGQLSLAHDLLGRTEEVAVTRLGGTHSETVQVKRDLYDLSRQLGHLDQAESYLVEVLGVVRAHGETEEFLEILELLAQLAGERERLDNAALLYEQIVEARVTLYGEDHPSVAQALLWLSTALSRSGQGEAAEAPLGRAFSLLERQFIEDPKSLAQSLLAGAELMSSGGRPAAALEHQKRALDLLSSVLEDGHQSLWDTREMIASTLASLGRLEESIELLEFCLQHRQARDQRTGALLKNLAGLYLSLQRVDHAELLYRQASELFHQFLGPDHPASLAALEERIQLYHFTGRSQEALDLALTTIRATEQRYGAGHPNTAQVYASTAVLAHAARKWETAFELMKAAEAIWDSLSPRPNDVLSNCRLNMATCLAELGRNAEAVLALNKVTLAPGSPLEGIVRDLWTRLEASSEASAPAKPAAAPEPQGVEGRRSIKLSLGIPAAAAPVPAPSTLIAPTSAEPIPESAPVAAQSELNPFDDITVTELDSYDLPDLTSSAEQPELASPPSGDEMSDGESFPELLGEAEPVLPVPQPLVEAPAQPSSEFPGEPAVSEEEDFFAQSPGTDPEDDFFSSDHAASPEGHDIFSGEVETAEPAYGEDGLVDEPPARQPENEPAALLEPDVEAGEEFVVDPEDSTASPVTGSEESVEAPATERQDEPPVPPLWDDPRDPLSWNQGPTQVEAFPDGSADFLEFEILESCLSPDLPASPAEGGPVVASREQGDSASPGAEPTEESGAQADEDLPSAGPDDFGEDGEDGDDRRLHRRFNLGLNRFFELSLRNERGELFVVRSFLVDLSAGGLRVNSERPLPVKETFELTLPSQLLGEELVVPARVTWQRALFGASYIQGVEFLKVTDDQVTRIEAVLSEGDLSEGGRQHYRLYRPFPIQVSNQEHPEWLSSYASDLSLEGVGTRLETELRSGQTVRLRLGLEFELPTVEVNATVAWSRYGNNGVSHGLRFEEVGPVEARTIRLYIDRCLELSPD
jgi:tetratricopeptide (TPR) repeat protein